MPHLLRDTGTSTSVARLHSGRLRWVMELPMLKILAGKHLSTATKDFLLLRSILVSKQTCRPCGMAMVVLCLRAIFVTHGSAASRCTATDKRSSATARPIRTPQLD